MLMEHAQRLDDITRTLGVIIRAKLATVQQKMDIVSKMPDILSNKLNILNRGIEHAGQMLNSLSYKNVLSRGYAIARDENNNIISSVANADKIANIEFADGVANIQ